MKLNREQIIKALECCINDECDKCGRTFGNCQVNLMFDALALIKELTEENKKLYASYTELERKCASLNDASSRIKANTVQSMRSRIKARCIAGGIYPAFVENVIDQITKEMLEDSRCSG